MESKKTKKEIPKEEYRQIQYGWQHVFWLSEINFVRNFHIALSFEDYHLIALALFFALS